MPSQYDDKVTENSMPPELCNEQVSGNYKIRKNGKTEGNPKDKTDK